MKLKMLNVGNSLGVIIPKKIIQKFSLKKGDYVLIYVARRISNAKIRN